MKPTLEAVIYGLTAATMLAVGLELEVGRIPELVRRRFLLPGLLLGQILLIPAIAILVVRVMHMPDETKIVVLMLAACPTGNVANFFTLLGRGNLPLSVSSSAISCLLAPVTMPATFAVYRMVLGPAFPFMAPPGALLTRVFLLTWAPILLGIALRNFGGSGPTRFSLLLRNFCAAGIVLLCGYICLTRSKQLTANLTTNVMVAAVLIVASLVAAWLTAKTLRLSANEAICYVTAFPARNIGVLAVVTVATLHRFDDLVFILICFVLEALIILTALLAYRGHGWMRTLTP